MSTHNYNNACLFCRVTFKKGSVCPHCGRNLMHGGDRWRFPPKKDKKGWENLIEIIKKRNPYWNEKVVTHLLQKEIHNANSP
jgi:predicted amidophosphoribosyltransferase